MINAREITQSFSLGSLDPEQLIALRRTGGCTIRIPKKALDAAYPGYSRRLIRSMELTIPLRSGPFEPVRARLTLVKGEIETEDGSGLTDLLVGGKTSATMRSTADEAGIVGIDFASERYAPFEGSGAVSTWRLELTSDNRAFDFQVVSDVLLRIRYTAFSAAPRP